MPINTNPIDLRALAEMASNRVGNLNIPVPQVDYAAGSKSQLAAMIEQQKLQKDYAQMQADLQKQSLMNEGQLANTTLRNQGDMQIEGFKQNFQGEQNDLERLIKQQNADQQGQYYKDQAQHWQAGQELDSKRFGLDQQKFGFDQEKFGVETEQKDKQLEIGAENAKSQRMQIMMEKYKTDIEAAYKRDTQDLIKTMHLAGKLPEVRASLKEQYPNDPAKVQEGVNSYIDGVAPILKLNKEQTEQFKALPEVVQDNFAGEQVEISKRGLQLKQARAGQEKLSPWETEKQKGNYKKFEERETDIDKIDSFVELSKTAESYAKETPDFFLGPYASALNYVTRLPDTDPNKQKLSGILEGMMLLGKDALVELKCGTQGFTDKEQEVIRRFSGTTAYDKTPLVEVLKQGRVIATKIQYAKWKRNIDAIRKNEGEKAAQEYIKERPNAIARDAAYFIKNSDNEIYKSFKGLSQEEAEKHLIDLISIK
jgi:hypothetical protein